MVSGKAISSSHSRDNRRLGEGQRRKAGRARPPLDAAALRDLALSYAARFATTGARVEAYLLRKLKERSGPWSEDEGDGDSDAGETARALAETVPALVMQLIALGYVDDAAYARARARSLGARGMGRRRIAEAFHAAGVDEAVRADHLPGEGAGRRAAVRLAQKRRLGPFAPPPPGAADAATARKAHEKAIATMLRAGHSFDHARFVLAAHTAAELDEWLAEAPEDGARDEGEGTAW